MKEYLNQQDMKDSNSNNVFHLLLKEKQMTRRQIEAVTQLSWGAVSNVTSRLMSAGYINEVKAKNPGAGRTPAVLELCRDGYYVIGIDINMSGFRAVLLNLHNEVIYTTTCEPCHNGKHALLEQIISLIHEVLEYADGNRILCIGVAMQGLVDAQNGISVQFSSCEDWKCVPIVQLLEESLGIPVYLEHDPNCVLYAYSVSQKMTEGILVRIDDGIGMAVMMDGKIFERFGAFELGHTVVVPGGRSCECGNRGCLEVYATRKGLGILAGVSFDSLIEIAKERGNQGARDAISLFDQMAEYLGNSIANVAGLLNISEVVLCGDMLMYKDLFWEHFLDSVYTSSYAYPFPLSSFGVYTPLILLPFNKSLPITACETILPSFSKYA